MLSQPQLIELFDLVIIIPIIEVLLPEIILELLPHNFPSINILHFPEVLPPYGCSSSQIEDGYSSLHISWIVLDLEIFPHPKNPSFNFLTIIYLSIEGRRSCLLKLITRMVLVTPLPLILVRRRNWTTSGSFGVRWPTRRSLSSCSSALTSFGPYYPVPRVHTPLNVCQNWQHGCIHLILLLPSLDQSFIIFPITLHLQP